MLSSAEKKQARNFRQLLGKSDWLIFLSFFLLSVQTLSPLLKLNFWPWSSYPMYAYKLTPTSTYSLLVEFRDIQNKNIEINYLENQRLSFLLHEKIATKNKISELREISKYLSSNLAQQVHSVIIHKHSCENDFFEPCKMRSDVVGSFINNDD